MSRCCLTLTPVMMFLGDGQTELVAGYEGHSCRGVALH